MIEKPISKGPKKPDHACYQTLRDIVIPAGSILRSGPELSSAKRCVGIPIGHGVNCKSWLIVELSLEAENSGFFKKVIA